MAGQTNQLVRVSHSGIKIARRNINNLRYADDTTLMAESEEELKSFKESKKVSPNIYNFKLATL